MKYLKVPTHYDTEFVVHAVNIVRTGDCDMYKVCKDCLLHDTSICTSGEMQPAIDACKEYLSLFPVEELPTELMMEALL